MITDRQHLGRIIQGILDAALELQDAWLDEDRAANAPSSSGPVGTRRSGDGDPTLAIASRDGRYRDRDQLGYLLLRVHRQLADEVRRRTPVVPSRMCACCHTVMATHGRNSDNVPTLCWACDTYRRKNDYPCTDDLHDLRPTRRMCECPESCCQVCPDEAAEGRQYSERCRKRRTRGLWQAAS